MVAGSDQPWLDVDNHMLLLAALPLIPVHTASPLTFSRTFNFTRSRTFSSAPTTSASFLKQEHQLSYTLWNYRYVPEKWATTICEPTDHTACNIHCSHHKSWCFSCCCCCCSCCCYPSYCCSCPCFPNNRYCCLCCFYNCSCCQNTFQLRQVLLMCTPKPNSSLPWCMTCWIYCHGPTTTPATTTPASTTPASTNPHLPPTPHSYPYHCS